MTAIAHKMSALTVARHAEESSSTRTGAAARPGGSRGGVIGKGGTHVVSASVASSASVKSAAKLSKLDLSITGIGRCSPVGSVSIDAAVTPSAARLASAVANAVSPTRLLR